MQIMFRCLKENLSRNKGSEKQQHYSMSSTGVDMLWPQGRLRLNTALCMNQSWNTWIVWVSSPYVHGRGGSVQFYCESISSNCFYYQWQSFDTHLPSKTSPYMDILTSLLITGACWVNAKMSASWITLTYMQILRCHHFSWYIVCVCMCIHTRGAFIKATLPGNNMTQVFYVRIYSFAYLHVWKSPMVNWLHVSCDSLVFNAHTLINNQAQHTHVHTCAATAQIRESMRAEWEKSWREESCGGGGGGELGRSAMIHNEIINLEKKNDLCDIHTITQVDALGEHMHNRLQPVEEKSVHTNKCTCKHHTQWWK